MLRSLLRPQGVAPEKVLQAPEKTSETEYISISPAELIQLVDDKIANETSVDISNLPSWLQKIMVDIPIASV